MNTPPIVDSDTPVPDPFNDVTFGMISNGRFTPISLFVVNMDATISFWMPPSCGESSFLCATRRSW
jgi:hypothetical protein